MAKKQKNMSMDDFDDKYKNEVVAPETIIRKEGQVFRTGSLRLDLMLRGGFRAGTISELSGKESSGKSTCALATASQVLARGGKVLYLDLEYSLDGGTDYGKAGKLTSWLAKLGIDIEDNNFKIARPITGEDIYDMIEDVIRNSLFDLVVLDSLSAVMPRTEVEANQERAFGGAAKLHSVRLRRILAAFGAQYPLKTHVMIINQIRDNVNQGPGYGPKTTTGGGHAVKHYSRTRLSFYSKRYDKTNVTVSTVRVLKNAFSPLYEERRIFIHPDYGVDVIQEIIKYGIKNGFVEQKGAWYTLYDTDTKEELTKAQGLASLREAMAETPEYVEKLKMHIWEKGIKDIQTNTLKEEDFG